MRAKTPSAAAAESGSTSMTVAAASPRIPSATLRFPVGCRRTPDCRIVLIMKARPSAGGFDDPVTQADEAHREGRSPRDWAVDALFFLLGIGFTALVFVDA